MHTGERIMSEVTNKTNNAESADDGVFLYYSVHVMSRIQDKASFATQQYLFASFAKQITVCLFRTHARQNWLTRRLLRRRPPMSDPVVSHEYNFAEFALFALQSRGPGVHFGKT
jgi:hypothetical protein